MIPNRRHLKAFLSLLPHDKITIQVLLDKGKAAVAIDTEHFHSTRHVQAKYEGAKHAKVSHQFTKQRLLKTATINELAKIQKSGRAIWWMVNFGNGELNLPDSPNCCAARNVTHLAACFMDTDQCPFPKVKKYLQKIGLKPHIVVESSPGKYHLYFLLDQAYENNASNKSHWRAIQKCFSHLGDPGDEKTGMDYSMHDVSKVLRLPGFYHLKGKPHCVRVKKVLRHAPYSLNELFIRTDAEAFLKDERNTKPYTLPIHGQKIAEGNRHAAITEYMSSRSNFSDSPEDLLNAVYGFIVRNVESPKAFLPGGDRNNEVTRLVEYYVGQRAKEREDQQKILSKELLAETDKRDPFSLPAQFYYDCPGLAGQITKEICRTARYPVPSFTFASVVSALGTLKAKTTSTEHGHAPVNYFMCLSASGAGKNYPQEVLKNTFSSLNMGKVIENKIRSDRGILHFLTKLGGTGMMLLDEAEGFLTNLYDKDAAHYMKNCRELLLNLYTSNHVAGWSSGYTGKEEPTIIDYPRLNLVCYGVLHTLEQAFTRKTIADGLLQRFIVVTHYEHRERGNEFKMAKSLNGNLIEELRGIIRQNKLREERALLKIQDLSNKVNDSKGDKQEQLKNALLDMRASMPRRNKLRFTPDAYAMWEKFTNHLDRKYNKELDSGSQLEGLYTRGSEQVGRLACAICDTDTIDKRLVEYCIEFISTRIKALKGYCAENLDRGQVNKDMDDLISFVRSQMRKTGKSVVMWNEILSGFRIRDYRLRELIQFSVEANKLEKLDNYRDPDAPPGRKGIAYTLS